MLELKLACLDKKLFVLGVTARPSTFNIVHAELIELFSNKELVLHRKVDMFTLSAITQGGIVKLYRRYGNSHKSRLSH